MAQFYISGNARVNPDSLVATVILHCSESGLMNDCADQRNFKYRKQYQKNNTGPGQGVSKILIRKVLINRPNGANALVLVQMSTESAQATCMHCYKFQTPDIMYLTTCRLVNNQ